MIAVLSKPADQIGVSDLNELIDSEVPESDQIEFKETLSTKDGSPDRWITHRDRIGEKARNQILEETVAFANAYGGALLLGIRESESRPPVAAEIKPIPRCADLAERLKLKFRDCVEPQIPLIEIFAVPTDGDCGVVVIRTSRSRMAPHRVIPTGKCPIRRSDRCEEMTMREIQDLTLNLSRGLERLERQLEARSELFEKEFDRLTTPDDAWGIRATAAPVGEDIRFDRVYGVADLCTPWREVSLILENGREIPLDFPSFHPNWRPRLRAARGEDSSGSDTVDLNIYREIHCDGLIEIGLVYCERLRSGMQSVVKLFPSWPVAVYANLIVWANAVRHQASSPSSEYAIDIEVKNQSDYVSVRGYDPGAWEEAVLKHSTKYPQYSLGEPSEIPNLISQFERDFWNSIGLDVEPRQFVVER